jgi:ribosomal protein S18 acetylase RimI-like enzyme
MQIQSRPYILGDYENYLQAITKKNMQALFIDNFGGWSDEVSKRKLLTVAKTGKVELFFVKEKFVGYVSFETEKNHIESILIQDIHVIKKEQQKGYGETILQFVVQAAVQSRKEQLKVFVFENNPSLQFYTKHGFKKIEFLEKSKTQVLVRKIK